MAERISNPFATPKYTREFLSRFHLQQSQQAQLQQELQEYVEKNMQYIHSRAEDYEVLMNNILEDLAKGLAQNYDVITKSNTFQHGYEDFFHKIHTMMQSRKRKDRDERDKFFDAQYRNEHPKRGGWGRFRNQTRAQIQPGVDRAAERMINRELDEAAEDDRKAGLDVYK